MQLLKKGRGRRMVTVKVQHSVRCLQCNDLSIHTVHCSQTVQSAMVALLAAAQQMPEVAVDDVMPCYCSLMMSISLPRKQNGQTDKAYLGKAWCIYSGQACTSFLACHSPQLHIQLVFSYGRLTLLRPLLGPELWHLPPDVDYWQPVQHLQAGPTSTDLLHDQHANRKFLAASPLVVPRPLLTCASFLHPKQATSER